MCVLLFAAWGALKALWEEKRGFDVEIRAEGRRIFLSFQSDAESERRVNPLWLPCLMTLVREAAWHRSERSRRTWSCTHNAASSSYNLSVIWNMSGVCDLLNDTCHNTMAAECHAVIYDHCTLSYMAKHFHYVYCFK